MLLPFPKSSGRLRCPRVSATHPVSLSRRRSRLQRRISPSHLEHYSRASRHLLAHHWRTRGVHGREFPISHPVSLSRRRSRLQRRISPSHLEHYSRASRHLLAHHWRTRGVHGREFPLS